MKYVCPLIGSVQMAMKENFNLSGTFNKTNWED